MARADQELHVVVARVVVGRVDGQRLLQLEQCGIGVARGQQLLCRVGIVGAGQLFFGRHVLVEELADLRFGHSADEAIDRLPAREQHAERDAAHAEHLAQLLGDLRHLVGVQLGQQEAAVVVALQLFQHRAELLAGPAPLGPDVQQHGLAGRCIDEVGLEIVESDVNHREHLGVKSKIAT